MNRLTETTLEDLQAKMGNAAKNIVDSNFRRAVQHLERACDKSVDGTGKALIQVEMSLARDEDGILTVSTKLATSHKDVDRDILSAIVIDPNQPLLPLGEGDAGME